MKAEDQRLYNDKLSNSVVIYYYTKWFIQSIYYLNTNNVCSTPWRDLKKKPLFSFQVKEVEAAAVAAADAHAAAGEAVR